MSGLGFVTSLWGFVGPCMSPSTLPWFPSLAEEPYIPRSLRGPKVEGVEGFVGERTAASLLLCLCFLPLHVPVQPRLEGEGLAAGGVPLL